ncbi:hypothetical protein I4U23_027850 [Adineta vaga]|nr:hypothetical protein I4U23_027850 [Adineta vaga]
MSLIRSTLELLPDEMLLEICRYLHSGDVLYAFYGLNSRLNQSITFYRQHISLHRVHYIEFLHIFNNILPQIRTTVRSLVIFELESPLFLHLFSTNHICENLEKLTLVNWTDEKLIVFLDTLHNMKHFHRLIIQALDLTDSIKNRNLLEKILQTNENRLTHVIFDHECDSFGLINEDQQYDKQFLNIIQLNIELQTTKDLFQLCHLIPNVEKLHITFKRPWSKLSNNQQYFSHLKELHVYAMSWFSTVDDFKALINISLVLENVSFILVSHDYSLVNGEHVLSYLPSLIKKFDYSICYQPTNLDDEFDANKAIQSWKSIPIQYSICENDKRIFLHTINYQSNRLSLRSLFYKNMSTKLNSQVYKNVRHVHIYDTIALAEMFGIIQNCRQILDLIISMRTLPPRNQDPIKSPVILPDLNRLDFLSIQGTPPDTQYMEKILSVAPNLSALSIDFDYLYKLLIDDDQSLLLYYLLSRRVVILCVRFENTSIDDLTSEHIHSIARIFFRVDHICFDLRNSKLLIKSSIISLIINYFSRLIVLSMYGQLSEDIDRDKNQLYQYLIEHSIERLKDKDKFQIDYGNERVKVWIMSDSKADNNLTPAQKPVTKIKDISMMKAWKDSKAYREYTLFVQSLNRSVHGLKNSDSIPISPTLDKLINLLNQLDTFIDQCPPKGRSRFGDAGYRDWHTKLEQESERLLKEALPEQYHQYIEELNGYLCDSFGNSTRLDYGTGHELAFALFLLCLCKIEALTEQDSRAIVLRLFARYLDLCRKLQRTYYLEPAGSKGQWCLDDYQFLPFLWGSSQLNDDGPIEPKQAIDERFYRDLFNDYLYLGAIKYINEVKTGPFFEHSSTLYDISNVAHWSKVNQGMLKMYYGEVLDKFPIAQHILFGNLISFDPVPKSSGEGLFKKPTPINQQ